MKFCSFMLMAIVVGGVAGCHTTPSSDSASPASALPPVSSPIVLEVEAAGSGDISAADAQSITPWFVRQPENFKGHLYDECRVAEKSANTLWKNQNEGKVCTAVVAACSWNGCKPYKFVPFEPGKVASAR